MKNHSLTSMFEPDKITKEHILKAVEKIEMEKITLTPSKKYLVEINGKKYPPKEVMRYAHEQMNGQYTWKRNGGDPTNKYLEKHGFVVIKKHKEEKMSQNKLDNYSSSKILRRCGQLGIPLTKVINSPYFSNSGRKKPKEPNVQYRDGVNGTTGWGDNRKPLTEEDVVPFNKKELLKLLGYKNTNKTNLNQILFGPPVTGKTYNTIKKSVEIANPEFDIDSNFKDFKEEFNRLIESKQIVFTTFHQSMNYEDFIEGIKPQEPKKEGDPINYKVENGIFKENGCY